MEINELIEDLRKEIDTVEAENIKSISIHGLRSYLDLAEKDIEYSNDFLQREHEGILADRHANNLWGTELFKAVLESGKSALHSIIIINGGAVIALMGVMSSLVGKSNGAQLGKYLSQPLLLFGLGVFCGGVGFALRYLSQACYTEDFSSTHSKYEVGGHIFRWLSVIFALSGYVLFCIAIIGSFNAFKSVF